MSRQLVPSLIIACLICLVIAQTSEQSCSSLVEQHLQQRTKHAVPFHPDNLLYFLHIPRTAGRTFHMCFLKISTPINKRCPKAYDHLRVDKNLPNCNLLSSHDDFSVVDLLSSQVSVITQLRDPLDRFLSGYEFAIEVAVKMLMRPESSKSMTSGRIATEEVWPWSYFIPFFMDDISRRKSALTEDMLDDKTWAELTNEEGKKYMYNKLQNLTKWPEELDPDAKVLPPLDPYDNPLVMPLKDFIHHPITYDLLHEGALLQILGLTNYSHYEEAKQLRQCIFQDTQTHQKLLQVALDRLDTFSHVGTTDLLGDSVATAAALLNRPLSGPSHFMVPGRGHRQQQQQQQERKEGDSISSGDGDGYGDDEEEEATVGLPDAEVDFQRLEQGLMQARARLQTVHGLLRAGRNKGVAEAEMDVHRHELDEAKMELRVAQDALIEARSRTTPKRKLGNVGEEYAKCTHRAKRKNRRRKVKSLSQLKMPDGRVVMFTRKSRAQLAEGLLEQIRERNRGDMELFQKGRRLLVQRVEELKGKGKLEEVPGVEDVLGMGQAKRVRRVDGRHDEL